VPFGFADGLGFVDMVLYQVVVWNFTIYTTKKKLSGKHYFGFVKK
jgi:hypothetical protein